MTKAEWITLAGFGLALLGAAFAMYARLVRVETMLAPIVKWFNDEGPLAWREAHLYALREGATAAVLKIIEQDRARRGES